VLFIAHRRELINQAYARLHAFGIPERDVGVIMASDARRRPTALVQVASVDTLRMRPKPEADIVFVDECHRCMAKSYRDIAAAYPNAIHLGLTATPYRADGKGLGDAYDELIPVASPKQLIADGFLVEPRVFTVPQGDLPDLSGVKTRGGDYEERSLAQAMDRAPLVGNIVDHWLRLAEGLRTVVFAVSIAHSRHIVERFNAVGVAAEHLDGRTPTALRDAILRRVEDGTTTVVSNVGCLCEGWDQPSVKCGVLARPTKSTGLYLQQAGRILRPWNGARALLLDHAGCVQMHGLPQDDREFSLVGDARRTKKTGVKDAPAEKPVRTCAQCCAVVAPGVLVCPECGHEFPAARVPEETKGNLIEISCSETAAENDPRFAKWREFVMAAAKRGFKPGWAFYRFKELYGTAPPKSFQQRTAALASSIDRQPAPPPADLFDRIREAEPDDSWARARYAMLTGQLPPRR
jgi:superfamily II DNA or RNA helicase